MGSGHLLDRLLHLLHRRSQAAESLLYTLCHLEHIQEVRVFLVGGLVRDILLDDGAHLASALDVDLAVEGDPSPVHAAVAAAANSRPVIHDRFGTASVSLPDGTRVDVARARSERYPAAGALPIVSPASIETDLSRRDFTVNALALPLSRDRCQKLLDPHGGLQDLKQRSIRTLHRGSFRDDPTRLIRAARYAARLRGTIERRTIADARRDRHHLESLSPERFGDAWRLLLSEEHSQAALEFARRLKIPQAREPRWVVPKQALAASNGPEQFWAAIGLLGPDPEVVHWLPESVGMRRRESAALDAGVRLRLERSGIGATRRASRLAERLGRFPDSALYAAQRIWGGASGRAVTQYLERRPNIHSSISARRLMELGVERGPSTGRWLRQIEAAIWDSELDPGDPASVARMEQRIRLSR